MEDNLKLYVLGALLVTDEDEPNEVGIEIGEFPYDDFYQETIGRSVDLEEEGYETINDVKEYLLKYPLRPEQMESITYLGIDTECSAYETLVAPYEDYYPGGPTTVFSLEGIEQLPRLRSINLSLLDGLCNLEPLTRLNELEEITGITTQIKDFSPLLRIETLKSFLAAGVINSPELLRSFKEIMEQLRQKGVQVEDLVTD